MSTSGRNWIAAAYTGLPEMMPAAKVEKKLPGAMDTAPRKSSSGARVGAILSVNNAAWAPWE
ncbi:MAG: hypothetical protein ABI345_14260 [Jatrophihabitans sp.]